MRSTGHNEQDYRTIDGNYAKAVQAYCTRYQGYVTFKQMRTHGCLRKHGGACSRLQDMKGGNIKRMTQTQFQDKIIDRMDKMIVAMNKLSKTLEAMQKSEQLSKSFTPSEALVVPMNTHVHLEAKSTDSPYGNITIE